MAILRGYSLLGQAGEHETLLRALQALADHVRALPGCTGVEVAMDIEQPERVTFQERWTDQETYRAGGAMIDKGLLAGLMTLLAEPPRATTQETVLSI